ncbi:hypothetical protein O7595_31240 [Streptomyces sp. WMMC940]|nr:hypothetical protein [Streptomyces sp. WMMC940]MCZ7461993.1 hypothetical protein [Streptomyces sp. WMMC940]
MTVEVAMSVMASARAGHLLLCDEDGQCTTRVTSAQLSAVRGSAAYTDRVRLRDVLGDWGGFHSAVTSAAEQSRRTALCAEPRAVDEPGGTTLLPR